MPIMQDSPSVAKTIGEEYVFGKRVEILWKVGVVRGKRSVSACFQVSFWNPQLSGFGFGLSAGETIDGLQPRR
jgi:hypothetical protein